MKFVINIIGLAAVLMMVGCRAVSEKSSTAGVLGVPYSKGPDSAPMVKGPGGSPSQMLQTPQARTEVDNGHYELPSN